jgi:hypothetical protein
MKMDRLKEVLAAEPPPREVALRAARARQRALADFDAAPAAQPWWAAFVASPMQSAAALIAVVAVAGVLAFQQAPEAPARSQSRPGVAAAKPAGARLEMNFQLSDGTKVRWVFNENFAL